MVWLIWVIGLLAGAGIVLGLTVIRVDIHFRHVQKDDEMKLKVSVWHGLLRYTFKVPVLKKKEGKGSVIVQTESGMQGNEKSIEIKRLTPADFMHVWSEIRALIEHIVGLHRIVRRFLATVHLKRLEWHSVVGAGQAAHTGMLVGGCWALKGSIIGLLSAYLRIDKRPDCLITPDFNQYRAATVFSCTLKFRLFRAIGTLLILSRHWKNQKAMGKTGKVSDSPSHKETSM